MHKLQFEDAFLLTSILRTQKYASFFVFSFKITLFHREIVMLCRLSYLVTGAASVQCTGPAAIMTRVHFRIRVMIATNQVSQDTEAAAFGNLVSTVLFQNMVF